MKKCTVLIVIVFVLFMATGAMAELNISGVWATGDKSISNEQTIYSQRGNKVVVTGYFEINGAPHVWHGTGTLKGNALEYSYSWGRNPDMGNGPNGKHVITFAADGKSFTCQWSDNNGNSGTFRSIKRK